MTILGKKQMSEEDIKLNFITPVIQRGWKGHITMEPESQMAASTSEAISWLAANPSLPIICCT